MTDLPNSEAIFNICANLTQIVLIRSGLIVLASAVLIAFLKQWKTARNYFLIGLGITVVAVAVPSVLNWSTTSIREAHAAGLLPVLGALNEVVALISVVASLGLLYLPVHIAKKRQNHNLGLIIGLSAFSIPLPLLWSIAVWMAYDEKNKQLAYDKGKKQSAQPTSV